MLKAAENLEFEEAARIRDEIRRLEAVDLAVADDPLARQSAVEQRVAAAGARSSPRSSSGQPGTRTYKGKRRRRKGP
jgi:excinuclease ABC subunit B